MIVSYFCGYVITSYSIHYTKIYDYPKTRIPFLKLHGSINWNKNENVQDGKIFCLPEKKPQIIRDVEYMVKYYDHDSNIQIVPPSWNKYDYKAGMETVWKAAGEVLSKAKEIHIIGRNNFV